MAYDEQLDRVYKIIESIGLQLKENHPEVLEPTIVEGLEDFGNFQLLVRTITKVKPGKHLQIQRQLRQMIKEAFEREGIQIPFGQRVRLLKEKKRAIALNFSDLGVSGIFLRIKTCGLLMYSVLFLEYSLFDWYLIVTQVP